LGAGLARIEFEGFRVPLGRVARALCRVRPRCCSRASSKGYCEYDGKYIKQPRRDIRPKPFKSFKGRTYAAAVSPESSRIMAKPRHRDSDHPAEALGGRRYRNLTEYRHYLQAGEWRRAAPDDRGRLGRSATRTPDRARERAVKYIGGYWDTALRHYEMASEHFGKAKGYEYYRADGEEP
jgi:hypothetical protein